MTTRVELRELKDEEYLNYIRNHIKDVKDIWKAFWKSKEGNQITADDCVWHNTDHLIKTHDTTKTSPEEFMRYREKFFPLHEYSELQQKEVDDGFKYAFNWHQKSNPHHWEFWVFIGKNKTTEVLPMPLSYRLEMLCDWSAMSLKFGNTPSNWYEENKDRIWLHEETKEFVEKWLPVFDLTVKRVEVERKKEEKQ